VHGRSPGTLRRARPRLLRLLTGVAAVAAATLAVGAAPAAATITSPAAAAAGSCSVNYNVSSDWGTGFTVSLTITNNGPAISSWSLQYSYSGNQQLQNGWSGTWSQSGEAVTVTSASWNGGLATGATTTVGASFSSSGSNVKPSSFTLNGTACVAGPTPTVTVTSPANNTFINQGTPVTLQASVNANGFGTVTSVTYFATYFHAPSTVVPIGTTTTAPYSFAWTPPVQIYYLWATVTTSTGATATSTTPVELIVGVNGTPPP
jgi:Cellulose binding domain/Bacterial Ig domain